MPRLKACHLKKRDEKACLCGAKQRLFHRRKIIETITRKDLELRAAFIYGGQIDAKDLPELICKACALKFFEMLSNNLEAIRKFAREKQGERQRNEQQHLQKTIG